MLPVTHADARYVVNAISLCSTATACRMLHATGTALVVLFTLFHPYLITSTIFAGCVGYVLCPLLAGFEHGFVEFGALLATFLLVTRLVGGSVKKAFLCPLIGYFFAWVGHFHFGQCIHTCIAWLDLCGQCGCCR